MSAFGCKADVVGTQAVGSLKCTHHFGLKRFFTLEEQLILQRLVTQSISLSLPPLTSVLGAAALAAGDKLAGTICFGSQDPPIPLMDARHCSIVMKPQLVPPPPSTAHHLYGSAASSWLQHSTEAISRQPIVAKLRQVFFI